MDTRPTSVVWGGLASSRLFADPLAADPGAGPFAGGAADPDTDPDPAGTDPDPDPGGAADLGRAAFPPSPSPRFLFTEPPAPT